MDRKELNENDCELIYWLVDRIKFLRKAKSNQQLTFTSTYKLPNHIKILKRSSIYTKDFLHLLEKNQLNVKQLDENPLGTQLLINDKINGTKVLLTVYYYDLIESLGFAVNKKSVPNRILNDIRNYLDQGKLYSYDSLKYKNTIVVKDYPNKNALALLVGIYLHRNGLIEKKTIIFLYEELLKDLEISFTHYDSLKDIDLLDDIISNFKLENSTNSLIKFIRMHYRGTKARHFERNFYQISDSQNVLNTEDNLDNKDSDWQYNEYAIDRSKEDFDDGYYSNYLNSRELIYGLKKPTVYTLIRRGKINIPRKFGRYDFDGEEAKKEIDNYRSHKYDMDRLNQEAEKTAARKGIKVESVMKTIRRKKKKGMSADEIIDYLRDN
jgi:hypothetical protein